MEHHTYAKTGSKKWSAQEKRELVEQRIAADDLFSKYSPRHPEPWKKFKEITKIGGYSENALRRQWFSMIQRYRVLKANAVGKPLNRQTIVELNQEWEFFGLIHSYMNQKTADLHSYALKEPNVEPPVNTLAISSVFSCEESQLSPLMLGVLNDHNFGERSPPVGNESDDLNDVDDYQQPHGGGGNNDELNKLLAETQAPNKMSEEDYGIVDEVECGPVMIGGEVSLSNSHYNDLDSVPQTGSSFEPQIVEVELVAPMNGDGQDPYRHRFVPKPKKKRFPKGLTEKEKYYRHRRYFEKRLEKRLAGICTVVANVITHSLPNVDVKPILELGNEMANNLLSPASTDSEDEVDDEGEEEMEDEEGF
ncbi:uncharacterized protein [Drosophila bipectinata]|uniref:uncharacterized protein n=1 Tax=Drosophila bipectinata TaxID=42026 RepID=UPI001C8A2FA3|nr:uncharacterized protein LOC108119549 [Drosophila bipectinata]